MRFAICALLATALAAATATAATDARPPSLILFNLPAEVETGFGVVRPDGGGRRILSRRYRAQEWSADGRQIVAYGGATGLAVLDDRGRLVRTLPLEEGALLDVRWSPDGRWLAGFVDRHTSEFSGDLWIVRADGRGKRKLVSGGVLALGSGSLHAWAPDGRVLAYSGAPTSTSAWRGIVLVTTTGHKTLQSGLRAGAEPTWSPDGRRLAFTRYGRPGRSDIYSARRDGRDLRRLTRSGRAFQPVWSPDGEWFVFLETAGDRFVVKVADESGRRVRNIATVGSKASIVWSPNGGRLLWSDYHTTAGTDHVFVARADGRGDPRSVTEGEEPDWR